MSTQLNEMGAWFFLRMREWGIGRVGRNSNWAEYQFWKNIFKFSWVRKHKNDHFSLMRQRFTFPHDLEGKNVFGNPIGHSCSKKARKTSESEPFTNFSCPTIWILHILGFPYVDCALSHSPLSASCFSWRRLSWIQFCIFDLKYHQRFCFCILQQSVWHQQCSKIRKLLCVYVIPGVCYVFL